MNEPYKISAVVPVTLEIDGVPRELRFSRGARKLIYDQFGMEFHQALVKHMGRALPFVLYALFHDEKGHPPSWVESADALAFSLPTEDDTKLMAVIVSAASQGKKTPEEVEQEMRKTIQSEIEKLTSKPGSLNTDSAPKSSGSQKRSTGGSATAN